MIYNTIAFTPILLVRLQLYVLIFQITIFHPDIEMVVNHSIQNHKSL